MRGSGISKQKLKQIQTKFKEIDAFFAAMEQDKSLPTFSEFFMLCMLLGTAESVNLQKMYPAMYKKAKIYLEKQKEFILL